VAAGPAALWRLAEEHGLLPGYVDVHGIYRPASVRSVCGVLRALGLRVRTPDDANRRLADERRRRPPIGLEPVYTARAHRSVEIVVEATEAAASAPWRIRFRKESGSFRPVPARQVSVDVIGPSRSTNDPAGRIRARLRLGVSWSAGYYELEIGTPRFRFRTFLIVRPRVRRNRSSRGPARRWGVFVPLYAVQSEDTWGCGDFTALDRMVRCAARWGAHVVGTLPLLPSFLGRPYEPSPYRPVSRRFWNEAYVDVTAEPEFRRSPKIRAWASTGGGGERRARLNARPYVDFRGVAALKREALEFMLEELERRPSRRRTEFHRFVRTHADLRRYARFRARQEVTGATENRWRRKSTQSGRHRTGETGEASAYRYHCFAQWLAFGQFERVAHRARRRGVDLYLDLPLGVHPEGSDATGVDHEYAEEASIGAPPDPLFAGGQNWAIPPPDPERLRAQRYSGFIAAVRHHLRVARVLRIDHVMAFHRLYWIPRGASARDGVYVRYRPEEFYAILQVEAARSGATIVGEDLGTVPPEVRPALQRAGILRTYVAQLEWPDPSGRGAPPVPPESVAMLNTHDMPTFGAYWLERRSGARSPPSGRGEGRLPTESLRGAFDRAVRRLARSPARIVLINLEDLWFETRPQNVPGTSGISARNFCRKMRRTLEDIERDRELAKRLSAVGVSRRPEQSIWSRDPPGVGAPGQREPVGPRRSTGSRS
jgi:4-alpha-glucanotransferase